MSARTKLFEDLFLTGKLELELNPQGTLAERIRAGAPAFRFLHPHRGRHRGGGRQADRRVRRPHYVRECWLRADLSMVKAWKGDTEGNLIYRKTARISIR